LLEWFESFLPIPELILITDTSRMERERFFEIVEASLCGGVDAVLVREKQMDSARLLAFCSRLKVMTTTHDALLIVHSQADVAEAVGADGVHVGAGSIDEIPAMRQWLNRADIMISASCHLLSPVFPTASHPGVPHLGAKRFQALAKASPLPVVALGGITPENRSELADHPVAAISAILNADDPELASRQLHEGSICL